MKKETIKIVLICLFILSGYAVIALQWEATKPFRGEDKHARLSPVMLAAHHPLISFGAHGGFYSMKDLVRPMYLFEQIIRKSIFAGRQELHNAIYKNMSAKIQRAIQSSHGKEETPIISAAGHDHSMQIIKDGNGMFHLVSGAGSGWNATRVGQGKGTLFSHANKKTGGFIAVDYLQSGGVRLSVIEPLSNGEECKHNGGKACVVFSAWVKRPLN